VIESLKLDDLRNSSVIEVTVWDSPKSSKKEKLIGCLRLGPRPQYEKQLSYMDSSENELSHWMSAINTPGECVEQLHTLRHTLDPLPITLTLPSVDISDENVNGNNNSLTMSVSTDEALQSTVALPKQEETPQETTPQETAPQETTPQETTTKGTQGEVSKTGETIVHEVKIESGDTTTMETKEEEQKAKPQLEVTSTPLDANDDIRPELLLVTSEQVPVEMLSYEDNTSVSCLVTLSELSIIVCHYLIPYQIILYIQK